MRKWVIVKLLETSKTDLEAIKEFYNWQRQEKTPERHTCRPVKKLGSFEAYHTRVQSMIKDGIKICYIKNNENEICGKLTMFNYNERNRSAEFGYYLPEAYRQKGYGSKLVKLFLDKAFQDETLKLNKLYATTASGNVGSIKLLEKHHFTLDGVMREHYWFDDTIEDQLYYSLLKSEWATL